MSQDDLSRIWGWRLMALASRVSGLESEMAQVRLRLGSISPIQTSPPSSPSPTATPATIRSDSWPLRFLRGAAEKVGREAISSVLLWLLGRIATWIAFAILGLPALAWLWRPLSRLFGLG